MSAAGSPPAVTAWVALGANLGDACATLAAACVALDRLPHTRVEGRSSWYRSVPVQARGPDFINAVVRLRTALPALELLDALQALERQHGRERSYRNAPRTLDLDLLAWAAVHLDSERLSLPHPRWAERAFVLLPLLELCPADALVADPVWQGGLRAAGLATPADLVRHAERLAAVQGIERLAAD